MAATTTQEPQAAPYISLSDRGRIRAILVALEARWDGMHPWDRAQARHLLGELARCYRDGRPPAAEGQPLSATGI